MNPTTTDEPGMPTGPRAQKSWLQRVSRPWMYFGLVVVAAIAILVIMLVWSITRPDPVAPVVGLKPYSELEKPATMTPDQQRVFDQVVASTVDDGSKDVSLIPGPDDERCGDAVFQGASEYQYPTLPGPYLGEGLTMVVVELPAADRVKVSFYSCSAGD